MNSELTRQMRSIKLKHVFLISLLLYSIHISGYIFTIILKEPTNTFSLTTCKGDQEFSFDYCLFSSQIRDSYKNVNILFQQDSYVLENSGKSFPNGNLVYFLASILMLFTKNITIIFVIAPLFSVFLTVYLIYLLFRSISIDVSIPVFFLCSIVFLLTDYLLFNPISFFKSVFEWNMHLGYISRFPHIQFTIPLLLFWFYRLIKCIKNCSILNSLILALSLIILQYSYFYYFTGALVLTVILMSFYSYKWKNIKQALVLLFTYIIGATPFWINFFKFNATELGKEHAVRVGQYNPGLIIPLDIIGSAIILLLISIVAYKFVKNFRKEIKTIIIFSSGLLLSIICLLNIQVILGYTVQEEHWRFTFYYPLFVILFFLLLFLIYKSLQNDFIRRICNYILYSVAAFFILCSVYRGYNFGNYWKDYFVRTKSEEDLFKIINQQKNKVFFSNNLSLLNSIVAGSDNYSLVPNGFINHSSNYATFQRFVYGYKLIGYTKDEIVNEAFLSENWVSFVNTVSNPPEDGFPENYLFVPFMFHYTYSVNWNYTISKSFLDTLSDVYDDNSYTFDLEYIVIYKKTLKNRSYINNTVVFENSDFILYKL